MKPSDTGDEAGSSRHASTTRRKARVGAAVLVLLLVAALVAVRCNRVTNGAPSTAIVDCATASLLVDCDFESPEVPAGGFTTFPVGAHIGGWTVVGAAGNVAPLSTLYRSAGLTWPAQHGAQTLDLTGLSNTATGVSQTVATKAKQRYRLSFWMGNVVNPGGIYGTTTTVDVLVDGQKVLAPSNGDGAGTTTLAWKEFSVEFRATSTATTIEFVNADPPTDNSNIIDNVLLAAAAR